MSEAAEIIDACLEMNHTGINQGASGNVSVRHGGGILITPTSLAYHRSRPEYIIWMEFDGTVDGKLQPSSEWRFHVDIMRSKPDVGAVVHAHPTACTTLAIMEKAMPPTHYMVAICGGLDIRCAPYATYGTEELSRYTLEALEGRSACLLAHHGAIVAGSTLDQAMWRAVEVETLAKQYLGCLPMGEPPLLSEAEIDRVTRKIAGYGHQD
ncbi:MAG: class II aldolase/adducin family protein [Geminicoccaceae bacterium]